MVQMRWYKRIPGDSNAPPGMTVEATSVLRRLAHKPDPWADIADRAGSAARAHDALGE